MAKVKQKLYVKPAEEIDAKIISLEKDILGNTRITIHQKRDMMAWREALTWVRSQSQSVWAMRLREVQSRLEALKIAREKQVREHDQNAPKDAPAADDGKGDGPPAEAK